MERVVYSPVRLLRLLSAPALWITAFTLQLRNSCAIIYLAPARHDGCHCTVLIDTDFPRLLQRHPSTQLCLLSKMNNKIKNMKMSKHLFPCQDGGILKT